MRKIQIRQFRIKAVFALLCLFISVASQTVSASAESIAQQALPQQLISDLAIAVNASTAEKLKVVNDYFNGLRAVSDMSQWRSADYWSTPAELLRKGGGDCEDFAIAKYLSLVQLGVAEQQLRLMYVKRKLANGRQEAHMVLSFIDADGDFHVLDNLNKSIKPLAQRTDLTPVYTFDSENVWLWTDASRSVYYGKSLQLTQWRAFLARI